MASFPTSTTAPPSYFVVLRSTTRQSNVFYTDESARVVDCRAWTSNGNLSAAVQAFTGNYYIRDYYGNQVATGAMSAGTSVPIPDGLPCGGYRIYLTQSVNDALYGLSGGVGSFLIVNSDARFPTLKGVAPIDAGRGGVNRDDCYMHGVTLMGPRRDTDDDPTNAAFTTAIETGRNLDLSWYQVTPDSVRPRPTHLLSTNLIAGKEAAWQSVVSTMFDSYGIGWFEGPGNEPAGSAATNATNLQTFSTQTKAARSGAKVMGPCPVTFNNTNNQPGTGYLHNVLNNLAAMNPLPIDGISFHGYNTLNGDLSLGRTCYQQLKDTIASVGLQGLPLWHTEQGYPAADHGTLMVRLQGRWTMLMYLLEEQYGIPKEQHVLFCDRDTGDYSVPFFYSTGDKSFLPALAMLRAYSAEIWGKTFTLAYDFGTPGNDMLLGSLYTSPSDGSQVVALQAAGSTDLTVKLSLTSGSPLTVVDCFGSTSTISAPAGTAIIPVPLEPVYVRVPAGVTVTHVDEWNSAALGADLCTSGTASASGGASNVTANAARMINGQQQSTYFNSQAITRTNALAPYVDDTNTFPAWARVDWTTAKTLDVVNVFAAPPWQIGGTLLDFDVQWLDADGTTWHTAATITEKAKYGPASDATANVVGHAGHAIQGGCTVESFFSDRWIFPVKFGSKVTTKAIRIYVRSATYGMDATIEAKTAKGSADVTPYGNNFTIRSIQAFNSTATSPYVVMRIS